MPQYYFHLVNAVFIGPNPDVSEDTSGAYLNCIVSAPNRVTAIETLISDLKTDGFFYEAAEDVLEMADAIEKYGEDLVNPEREDLSHFEGISYGTFHCYPKGE